MREPVNTEYDEHEGGEDVSTSADHHQNLASHVPSVPLKHLSSHPTFDNIITITSMTILQLVSMGMVMKEMTVSAMVRWKTR